MFDTGKCVSESIETLLEQQKLLLKGKRTVQMFPVGTRQLSLPEGFSKFENFRGVFHYNPRMIDSWLIDVLSQCGRENEFLGLGSYNKDDVLRRVSNGEKLIFVTEYNPEGIEVRSAAGTDSTISEQAAFFNATKEPENSIEIGAPPVRVLEHLRKVS